jgi:hypothetical protein
LCIRPGVVWCLRKAKLTVLAVRLRTSGAIATARAPATGEVVIATPIATGETAAREIERRRGGGETVKPRKAHASASAT